MMYDIYVYVHILTYRSHNIYVFNITYKNTQIYLYIQTVSRKSKTHERRSSVAVTKSHDAKGRNVYQLQPNDANENELSTDDDIDDDRDDDPLDHTGITPLRNKGNNNESSNNLLINVDRDVTPASNLSHLSDN